MQRHSYPVVAVVVVVVVVVAMVAMVMTVAPATVDYCHDRHQELHRRLTRGYRMVRDPIRLFGEVVDVMRSGSPLEKENMSLYGD